MQRRSGARSPAPAPSASPSGWRTSARTASRAAARSRTRWWSAAIACSTRRACAFPTSTSGTKSWTAWAISISPGHRCAHASSAARPVTPCTTSCCARCSPIRARGAWSTMPARSSTQCRSCAPPTPEAARLWLAINDGFDQGSDRRAHLRILDLAELAHQLDRRALTSAVLERHRLGRRLQRQTLEEIAHVDPELARQLEEAPRADPVGTGFVLLDLLVRYLQGLGQLLLGQAKLGAPRPDPLPDVLIDAPRPAFHVVPCRARGASRAAALAPTVGSAWVRRKAHKMRYLRASRRRGSPHLGS